MAWPLLGAAAGALARAGVIRGTAGRILGGGAAKAVPSLPPPVIQGVAGRVLPGAGAVVAAGRGGRLAKGAAAAVATGAAIEVGGRLFRPDGTPYKKSRRMNPANGRALKRAIRRVRSFEKMARKVMTFTTGRSCPRGKLKRGKSCR